MSIKYILFCEQAISVPGQKPVITSLLPGYVVLPFKPQKARPVQFSLAMAITTVITEPKSEPLKIQIFNPKGDKIGEAEQPSAEAANPIKNIDGLYSTFTAVDLRNFPFTHLGDYKFVVTAGQEVRTEILKATYGVFNDDESDD